MSRQQVAQQAPDASLDWQHFPRIPLPAGRMLYRAARRSPWWFCACGGCRFDLDEPRGTCYLGTDPVSGLLESIGPEWTAGRPLTYVFVTGRKVHTLELPARTMLANLSSRKALGFKVTNELSDMTPYDIPRAFAVLFDRVTRGGRRAFDGIRFPSRFDTGATTRGVALFGDHGEHKAWTSAAVRAVDEGLLQGLRALGVVVVDPPPLADLDQSPDP